MTLGIKVQSYKGIIHTPLVKMISNGLKKLAEHLAVAEFQEGKPFPYFSKQKEIYFRLFLLKTELCND
jgi:hypothetical protein